MNAPEGMARVESASTERKREAKAWVNGLQANDRTFTLEAMLAEAPVNDSPAVWLARLFDSVQQRTGRAPEDDWTAAMLVPREEEAP